MIERLQVDVYGCGMAWNREGKKKKKKKTIRNNVSIKTININERDVSRLANTLVL